MMKLKTSSLLKSEDDETNVEMFFDLRAYGTLVFEGEIVQSHKTFHSLNIYIGESFEASLVI